MVWKTVVEKNKTKSLVDIVDLISNFEMTKFSRSKWLLSMSMYLPD